MPAAPAPAAPQVVHVHVQHHVNLHTTGQLHADGAYMSVAGGLFRNSVQATVTPAMQHVEQQASRQGAGMGPRSDTRTANGMNGPPRASDRSRSDPRTHVEPTLPFATAGATSAATDESGASSVQVLVERMSRSASAASTRPYASRAPSAASAASTVFHPPPAQGLAGSSNLYEAAQPAVKRPISAQTPPPTKPQMFDIASRSPSVFSNASSRNPMQRSPSIAEHGAILPFDVPQGEFDPKELYGRMRKKAPPMGPPKKKPRGRSGLRDIGPLATAVF
jgi:hypothetical protein